MPYVYIRRKPIRLDSFIPHVYVLRIKVRALSSVAGAITCSAISLASKSIVKTD